MTTSPKAPPPPLHQRELLPGADVAVVLSLSRARFYEARKNRAVPEPVEVDGVPRWRRQELIDWVDAGCPAAGDWKWRPSLPAKLEDLIAIKAREAAALHAEVAELEARLRAGETMVHVKRGGV